jgi:23S rRNA (cytosine1962-C5)-methyltransferase
MVNILSHKGEYLGMGHYQSGTSIAVRVLSFTPSDEKRLFRERIQSAWEYRKRIGIAENPDTNAFRLIFAEGDGLSGLVVDYYNGVAVLQAHSMGKYLSRNLIAEIISELLGNRLKAVYDKSKETLYSRHNSAENGFILGSAEEYGVVLENGRKFIVNWVTGQKTGFFIDQRDNRLMVASYSAGKRVLNTFCYTGGFSVYAGSGNAKEVHSVDSSKSAINIAKENMGLNRISNYENFTVDVFDFLQSCNEYDIIIVDPPAFAKRLNARHQAVIGYKRLNTAAIKRSLPEAYYLHFPVHRRLTDACFRIQSLQRQ